MGSVAIRKQVSLSDEPTTNNNEPTTPLFAGRNQVSLSDEALS